MNFLGIHLTLLIGRTLAVPAPALLTEALQSVEVTHSDEGRSGFQLTFQVGRRGAAGMLDYLLLNSPLIRPFNRVILVVTFNATPRVLIDGVTTHHQYSPGSEPGASTFTVTGEDISAMMDMEKKSQPHPAQDETLIALKLIASYAEYGLIPIVIPPPVIDPPVPLRRVPVQSQMSDLQFLKSMAARYGYVFYISPGPAPFTNTAYWGPPVRAGVPQPALSVNLGPATNVDSISFQNNALTPTRVSGSVQDRDTNQRLPVKTFVSLRLPLASMPAWLFNLPNVRVEQVSHSRLSVMQAFARAQGMADAASEAVTASGELDALRYGNLLRPRALVGLRGASYNYDGFWYVKSVTHTIRKEQYKQRFTLAREGLGTTTPVVIP